MLFTYVELNNELYNPTEPDGVNTSASALEFKFTWFLENLKFLINFMKCYEMSQLLQCSLIFKTFLASCSICHFLQLLICFWETFVPSNINDLRIFHTFDIEHEMLLLKSATSFCGTTSIKQVVFQQWQISKWVKYVSGVSFLISYMMIWMGW